MGSQEEKPSVSISIDDVPHFQEKHPGKVCCLCNLGERSALGQGDFIRIKCNALEHQSKESFILENDKNECRDNFKLDKNVQVVRGRGKSLGKNRVLSNTNENINELEKVGQIEVFSLKSLLDGNYFYVHRMCVMWAISPSKNIINDFSDAEVVVEKSLKQKCSFCGQYGATVTCKMNCNKMYHVPCAAATECFLIIDSFSAFCPNHLHHVQFICTETNVNCRQCNVLGDISKLIMCFTCGDHYHTTCIGLANLPDTRSGWNCVQCSKCQICRQIDSSEGRSIKCEHCQKVYHASCLRPMISSIPKYGWKCNRCRVCTDCGSRTPGAGTSSRWHCHYTICDSCYQQRNKGFSCPICHKAYRAAAHKEMVKCIRCNRFVHSSCDDEAELSAYYKRKETNPDYDYYCPLCKLNGFSEKSHMLNNQMRNASENSEMYALSGSQANEEKYKDSDIECYEKHFDNNVIDGKPLDVLRMSKKRMGIRFISRNRVGKILLQKSGSLSQFGRRRGGRGKNRHMMMIGSNDGISDRNINRCTDDDWNMEKKLVLFSAQDKYLLSQDICVMCGSIGIDQDGCLIACTQCGQCYHPYCANIKLSLVVIKKGWRCLDCTVCEGCGQKNDEAYLILCDECDISYHTYCMNPPLDKVPNGNWKCKWCAICQNCGRTSPGKNSSWRNGFLECGPCASQKNCCVCLQIYNDKDLIIQCSNCERWLHCKCDSINNEKEAQQCDIEDYMCILCRPKNKLHPQALSKTLSKGISSSKDTLCPNIALNDRLEPGAERSCALNTGNSESAEFIDSTHCLDGVCVSERGLNVIKSLAMEIKKKRKTRPANDQLNKDSGILATIESVVAGSSSIHPDEDIGDDETKQKNEIYRDGMIWMSSENSPPQGFSISTNEEGVNILRKKRQRNLQKLGIGGFSVRNRAVRKDCDDNGTIAVSDNINSVETEKKKKTTRKKAKTKLCETYPIYLQEAFFGKPLLESKGSKKSFEESDSSEELGHSQFMFNDKNMLLSDKLLKLENVNVEQDVNMASTQTAQLLKFTTDAPFAKAPLSAAPIDITPNKVNNIKGLARDQKEPITQTPTYMSMPSNNECENTKSEMAMKKIVVDTTQTHLLKAVPKSTLDLELTHSNIEPCKIPNNSGYLNQHMLGQHLQNIIKTPIHTPMLENINNISMPDDQEIANKGNILKTYATTSISEESVEGAVVGSQKTAEKMRKDEDLGKMATISAVLYANTQHPELKQLYPNWNDRCKQIIKKWRSLSTEKKSPFLQHAKDNRSALRMRKSQQDHEKINFHQKTLKEQEQERIWKQHQAKAKEATASFSSETSQSNFNSDVVLDNNYMPNVNVTSTQRHTPSMEAAPNYGLGKTESLNTNAESDNKHLRTLLLKQDFDATWLPKSPQTSTIQPATIQEAAIISSILNVLPIDKENKESKILLPNKEIKIIKTYANTTTVKSEPRNRLDGKSTECTEHIGSSEIEKIEQDENVGFNDILGGFADGDDEDFLKSLTSDIGDDFNILEYGDPELDALATSQNLLQKLDFDDNYKNA